MILAYHYMGPKKKKKYMIGVQLKTKEAVYFLVTEVCKGSEAYVEIGNLHIIENETKRNHAI